MLKSVWLLVLLVLHANCFDQTSRISFKSAEEKGLIKPRLTPNDLVDQYNSYYNDASKSFFVGEALGYVTPWNSAGYDFAKLFRYKLTLVSPVWLQIRREGNSDRLHLTGTHDIDSNWMLDVKRVENTNSSAPKIVPRVILEISEIKEGDAVSIVDILSKAMKLYRFDGYVFELPISAKTFDFIEYIFRNLKSENPTITIILVSTVQTAISYRNYITKLIDGHLLNFVSVMTYDFGKGKGKPIAPLSWIAASLSSLETSPSLMKAVLMGIPFYGYDDKGDAIVWSRLMTMINSCRSVFIDDYDEFIDFGVRIHWNETVQEHEFNWKQCQSSSISWSNYPSLAFVDARLNIAKQFEVGGVSIWEIGQGPPILFDLL